MKWSNQVLDIPSLPNISIESKAKTDYNGEHNTDIIMSEDPKNVAAKYCRSKSITFGTTKKGYLGAAGEWWAIYNNRSQIDSALNKIGGVHTPAVRPYYWTSTKYSPDVAWYMSMGSHSPLIDDKSAIDHPVRPLYPL